MAFRRAGSIRVAGAAIAFLMVLGGCLSSPGLGGVDSPQGPPNPATGGGAPGQDGTNQNAQTGSAGVLPCPSQEEYHHIPAPGQSLEQIKLMPEGTSVVTEPVTVVSARNNSANMDPRWTWIYAAYVTVENANGTRLTLRIAWEKGGLDVQHRKQLGVPVPGMEIQAQGRMGKANEDLMWEVDRWAPLKFEGPVVDPAAVNRGEIPPGSWVWTTATPVVKVWGSEDGDCHVGLKVGSSYLVTEQTPPFMRALKLPQVGDIVEVFGMVLYDGGDSAHGWWEIHPVLCWSRTACAPSVSHIDEALFASGDFWNLL